MNRDTAQAIWYRRLDRRCFTSESSSTPAPTVTHEFATVESPPRGRWVPAVAETSTADEWPPLAENRRRLAVERG
ncbi:MAG: hypothetical protein AB7K36_20540 [Chloroflexota bacterium]